jgi:hypothetical protein
VTAEDQAVEATAEEIEDFRPSGVELVIADEESVFQVLDRHDEDQVLQMLQGHAVDEWFYKFPGEDGKLVVDLSIKGVFDTVGAMNRTGKIRMRVIPGSLEGATVDEDGEVFYEATVWAEDMTTGFSVSGHAYEPKRKKLKANTAKKYREKGKPVGEDDTVWNPFAKTIAVNKAERNALAKFIPQRIRLTLVAQYLKDPSRIKEIKAGAGAAAEADIPPPLTTPEAEEKKTAARAMYDEIRELDRLAVLPGVFHQRFIRAASSLETLDSFIEALEQKRDELKERTTA